MTPSLYLASLHAVNAATGKVLSTVPSDHGPTRCDTYHCSQRRSLLMAGDNDEMFMTRSLNITPKTAEQHLIACSDKPAVYV